MFTKTYQATHPDMMENASNQDLKDRYLVQGLFEDGDVKMAYTHNERMIIGGCRPTSGAVALPKHSEPESLANQTLLFRSLQ